MDAYFGSITTTNQRDAHDHWRCSIYSIPETAQRGDGSLSLSDMGLVAVTGLDTYTQPGIGVRFTVDFGAPIVNLATTDIY